MDKQGTHLICPTSKWFSDGVGWDPRPSLEAGTTTIAMPWGDDVDDE